jgi:hypothetical protein
MTVQQALNRGYNLMVTVFVLLTGLAFFIGALQEEAELDDKLDDIGLLVLGLILLGWYLMGKNRFKLSRIVPSVAVLALGVQIFGFVHELADPKAVGNDIGGITLFIPFVVFALFQYRRTARLSKAPASS